MCIHAHRAVGLGGACVRVYIAHDLQLRREENTHIQRHTHSLHNCFANGESPPEKKCETATLRENGSECRESERESVREVQSLPLEVQTGGNARLECFGDGDGECFACVLHVQSVYGRVKM